MSAKFTTTFTSRGRLAGLIRQPAGPAARTEALYYRARLILGESLPRPRR